MRTTQIQSKYDDKEAQNKNSKQNKTENSSLYKNKISTKVKTKRI